MPHAPTRLPRRQILCASAALLASSAMAPLRAQDRPPLRILVGFPPGGSADVVARAIGDAMRDDLGAVIVENRPGAAGRLAIGLLKNAKPDGQTVIIVPSPPMVLFPHLFKKLDYNPVKDFTPISQLALVQFGITAGPASGVRSMAEMIAKIKASPANASFASPGEGSAAHLLGTMLGQATGTTLTHVPFAGGAPANAALLGGHVAYKIDAVSESTEFHRAGKATIIAVAGPRRDPQVPQVPTLKESGINIEASAWFGMYAPAGLPAELQLRLQNAAMKAVKRPDVAERLLKLGFDPVGSTAAELAAVQRTDFASWERPAKATGLSLD